MSDSNYGYDDVENVAKQTSSGGKYLKLEDGREYQLRIVSEPKYVINHWMQSGSKQVSVVCTGKTCEYCGEGVDKSERLDKTAKWGWVVIDREDNKVKILQGPNKVALDLKTISSLVNKKTGKKQWGDPRTFDITIKKEKQGNFTKYTITPLPGDLGPIDASERAMVDAASIDLVKELKGGKKSDNLGNYSGAKNLETAPDDAGQDTDTSAIPKDVESATGGDDEDNQESVSADDIPF